MREYIKSLKKVWRENLNLFILSLGMNFISAYVFQKILQKTIDLSMTPQLIYSIDPAQEVLVAESQKGVLTVLAFMLAAQGLAWAIYFLLSFIKKRYTLQLRETHINRIREELMFAHMKQDPSHIKQDPGYLSSILTQDSLNIVKGYFATTDSLGSITSALVITAYFVFEQSSGLLLYFLITLPFLLVSSKFFANRIQLETERCMQYSATYQGTNTAIFRSWRTNRMFSLMDVALSKLRHDGQRLSSAIYTQQMLSFRTSMINSVYLRICQLGLFGFLCYMLVKNEMSFGTVLVLSTTYTKFIDQTKELIGLIPDVVSSSISTNRLMSLQSAEQENQSHIQAGIELRDLTLSYDKLPIISNFNLSLNPGERCLITGPNGTGKSTLLNVIMGFEQYQGHVGRPQLALVSASINPAYWPPVPISELIEARVHEMPELIQLRDSLGVSQFMNRSYENLSLGQKQLVNIMFCLAKEAEAYLFDEPFANIAESNRESIFHLILERCRNATLIMVMHDFESFKDSFDKTIYLTPHPDKAVLGGAE